MVLARKNHFVYLHGFNSSPQSYKAQAATKALESLDGGRTSLWVPELPYSPKIAIKKINERISELLLSCEPKDIVLLGSSLGGYYATHLVETWGCKAVLINPSVRPYDLLDKYLGNNTNIYTGEVYELTDQHLSELLEIDHPLLSKPKNYLLLVQTGDETLDYREAVRKFDASPCYIEIGGDHSFVNFEKMLPAIINFAGTE